jgi:chromosome segregation ATPase
MNTMPVAKSRSWNHTLPLLGAGDDMESLKVLEANLGHVQSDVSDIKNDQRRAGDKLDGMNGRLDVIRDKIDKTGGDANQRIDEVGEKVIGVRTDITAQLESVRKELGAEVAGLRKDLTADVAGVRKDLSSAVAEVRKDLGAEIADVRKELSAEIAGVRTVLSQKIDLMRGELFVVKTSIASAKVWTLTLQLTIAGALLAVVAHGFKWI